VGGEEVHDETYRKATKLNPSDFYTDFYPVRFLMGKTFGNM